MCIWGGGGGAVSNAPPVADASGAPGTSSGYITLQTTLYLSHRKRWGGSTIGQVFPGLFTWALREEKEVSAQR